MKPVRSEIHNPEVNKISVITRSEPHFTNVFHFHEECELVYVAEGKGKRIIGDHVAPFGPGDLVFVGRNLPHIWHNDPPYFEEDSRLIAQSVVVYFRQNIFGKAFFQLEETRVLSDFFDRAQRGILVHGQTKKNIIKLIKTLPEKEGIDRIISLFNILKLFSETKEYTCLAGVGYSNTYQPRDNHKIDQVFKFMLNNYHRNIPLNEVANLVGLTPESFCRFFKNRTQKSFVHFLNEIRIRQVCKQLAEDAGSISQIAYSCGFSNLSNFNRFFKLNTGKTPSEYIRELKPGYYKN